MTQEDKERERKEKTKEVEKREGTRHTPRKCNAGMKITEAVGIRTAGSSTGMFSNNGDDHHGRHHRRRPLNPPAATLRLTNKYATLGMMGMANAPGAPHARDPLDIGG